jgi:hypothetical protein
MIFSSNNESKQAHEDIYGQEPRHHASWSHELISDAASFAGKIDIIFTLF